MRLFTALPFLVLLVGASPSRLSPQGGGAPPIRPTRRDSGGITVLQHGADAFQRAPKWSLGSTPLVSAGGSGASPEFDLSNAWNVELMPDGRLVTLAPIGNRLLVFAPDGRPERSLGRQGKGPGEIMAPFGMSRARGDTLVIPDGSNNRINWILPARGFVANKPMPAMPSRSPLPAGVLQTGALVFSSTNFMQGGVIDSVTRLPTSVIVMPPGVESASIVTTVAGREVMRVATRYGGRPGSQALPLRFGRSSNVIAWDAMIATGSGDGYRIDLRDENGQLRSMIRVSVPRRTVTMAMRDSARAAALRAFNQPGSERLVDPAESKRLEEITPVADSVPPYGSWFVSPDRSLWIVDSAAPAGAAGAATAFAQDGSILGRLTWTKHATPVAFGNDRVVMRELDDDGVVSLGIYRIERRRP